METIAQKLKIKNFPFIIKDDGNEVYVENEDGTWIARGFDADDNMIWYEDSSGFSFKQEFNNLRRILYYDSNDYVIESTYTSNGYEIVKAYKKES